MFFSYIRKHQPCWLILLTKEKNMKKLLLSAIITGLMLISASSFATATSSGYYVGCSINGHQWLWIVRAANMQEVSELSDTCENQGGTPILINGGK
jgi:hypothetical protein